MLTEAIKSYVALHRAVGYAFKRAAARLRAFASFATARGDQHVRAQTAIDWARSTSALQERDRRLKTIARFARHVHAADARHEVPPDDLFPHPRNRPVPFIFTRTDVPRLVQEALRLTPRGSLRPLTFSTLFALLAACGLRVGEALALRLDDITDDGLIVRETKFRKSRLVSLHETAVAGLQRYLRQRLSLSGQNDLLLVDHRGRRLDDRNVRRVFRMLVRRLGLKRGPDQPTPHIHSLRHTFAVRALESCPHDRDQVGRHLLALSTYLGHTSVADTYWYLQSTPQLLSDISSACEVFLKGESR